MSLDWNALKFLWEVGITLASLIAVFATLWAHRHFAAKTALDGLGARLDKELGRHNDRLTIVEQALIHAPKKEDLAELAGQIGALAREVAQLKGEVKADLNGQSRTLALIQEYLLNKKG